MPRIHVTPLPGKIIRNPDNSYVVLGPDGAEVELTNYWIQHLRDGSVIQTGGQTVEF